MRKLVLALLTLVASCALAGADPVGYWPFDGSLKDLSAAGRHARGVEAFAEGRKGMALKLENQQVEIPDAPELQLSPGLAIDCWVYFEKKPNGYQEIIRKEKEYLLRVDGDGEGGHFRFFVYLNGWEPRVGAVVPEANRWYHLVARWNGSETSLEIDGQRSTAARAGTPVPTDNPVRVGFMNGRVDELKISNPGVVRSRELDALAAKAPAGGRVRQAAFGAASGWPGWAAQWGGRADAKAGVLNWQVPNPEAMLVNPALDVDTKGKGLVTVAIDCPGAETATLHFVTEKGRGLVSFPVWGGGRASLIDLSAHPAWGGSLKLLGLSLPEGDGRRAALSGLWLAGRPEGPPSFDVRSFSPERAILRAGREERLLAIVRNLGADSGAVTARLTVPAGVRILDGETRRIERLRNGGLEQAAWRVTADKPVAGPVRVAVASQGAAPVGAQRTVEFRAPAGLPKASYVPAPVPAKTSTINLMHYCPLWKEGTHYGWEKIEPWPDRKPAIGWYDEGTPEVADWHIKMALEHGIQGFIYCWYRSDFSPEIHQSLGHAIHDGLLKAKYLDRFKFTIMWENGCAKGIESRDDMMRNVLPFWMRNYFKHPSYLKIDNKPVLFVWRPERVAGEVGGSENLRKLFGEMRDACRKEGFAGLTIIGCVGGTDEALLKRMALEGWDASSAYGISGPVKEKPGRDPDGAATLPYAPWLAGQKQAWLGKRAVGAIPDIVDVMMGWDPRPWHGASTSSYTAGANPEAFKAACREAKAIVDATPGNGLDKRMVVFDNWCEFGEGHYLEPVAGYGFGFLDAIRDVFCDGPKEHTDIVPEDVGLETPDRVYRKRREFLSALPKERKVVDNLVAWWRFDEENNDFAMDSSQCSFHGVKDGFEAVEGVRGKGFRCKGGTVSLGGDPLFFPKTGITLELWAKTDRAEQSDRWMVNTVQASDTGYRLGLGGGKVTWQIPLNSWSHGLSCQEPLPLGRWVHIAATYDNEVMRLYLDGQLKGEMKRGGAIRPSSAKLFIGSYMGGHATAFFDGVLDEVRLYDRALSAEEVRARAAAR